MNWWFSIFLVLNAPVSAFAAVSPLQDEKYDDYDGASLALQLVQDDQIEAGEGVLLGLSTAEKTKHSALVARASGLIAYRRGDFERASVKLEEALRIDQGRSPQIAIELARTEHARERFSECADAALKAGDAIWSTEGTTLLRLACERKAHRPQSAWNTLNRGLETYPRSLAFIREKIDFLLELGLRERAASESLASRKSWRAPGDVLSLTELFGRRGFATEAMRLLDAGLLLYPGDADLQLGLAQAMFRKGQMLSSAHAFARLAATDKKFALHASELYRQEGWRTSAEYWHLFVEEGQGRLKQKLGFALDRSGYATIAAMTGPLSRNGLLEPGGANDDLIYASVFARFKSGETTTLLAPLAGIRKPELLEKSAMLRRVIEECRAKPELCRF